jgi:Ca-activated chloride channel homolog
MPTISPTSPKNQGLYANSPDGEKLSFPLEHTEVLAKIAGNIARVEVIQTFQNPFNHPLEAIYIFPLPDESAVDDMEIKIGDRIIKGNIKKREEAKKIYQEAKKQGKTVGLLEQERDNIFTQSLANILPGEKIDVTIRYTDSLKFTGGNYEFIFPMVVGPRYIPGNVIDHSGDTDQVPDANRISPPIIAEGMRTGHDIGVTVEIDAGLPINNIISTSHQIDVENQGKKALIKLQKHDNILNKDLILRYEISGKQTEVTVLNQVDERGLHFAVYLIPAITYNPQDVVAKDVIFLMDTSGSQMGAPLAQCKELMRRFINVLNPDDTFTIIDFDNTAKYLSKQPLTNTPQNRQKAINYINKLDANGGTELMNGINAVMNFPESPSGRLRSIVLLTDGYIGNDNEILSAVQDQLKPGNRLYSFGVGSGVNRYLLNRIAEIGRGTCQILRQDENPEPVAEKFFREINNPVLTNISITWEGTGEKPIIYPSFLPDLFAEQPLVLFGKKADKISGKIHIKGMVARGYEYEKTLDIVGEERGNIAIAQLWGRQKIKDVMKTMLNMETKKGVEEVTETALTYQLLSQYTSFVAVSDDVRIDPESEQISMEVPVEMPEGVSYQGVFASAPPPATMIGMRYSTNMPSPIILRSVDNFSKEEEDEENITWQDSADLSMPQSPPPMRSLSAPKMAKSTGGLGDLLNQVVESVSKVLTQDVSEFLPQEKTESVIKVISLMGLDQTAIAPLNQHLEKLQLPKGLTGKITFELTVNNGRVTKIMLDEEKSTLQDKQVIDMIKKSLLMWHPPQTSNNTVIVELAINS